jgi:hypothetical protein
MKLDVFFHAGESLRPALETLKSRSEHSTGLESALRQVIKVAAQQATELASTQAQGQEMGRRISELEAMVSVLSRAHQATQPIGPGIQDVQIPPATASAPPPEASGTPPVLQTPMS